jgi:hypothetical protein
MTLRDALGQTWERYVGVTPAEFLETETDKDINQMIDDYVASMSDEYPGIEEAAEDLEEYILLHLETSRDEVLQQLERLGYEVPVTISGGTLTMLGVRYHAHKLLSILESKQSSGSILGLPVCVIDAEV